MTFSLEKKQLRQEISSRMRKISESRFSSSAIRAGNALIKDPHWLRARSILAYLAIENELDSTALVAAAWKAGKDVYIPRVEGKDLHFGLIRSFDEPVDIGSFGIREPRKNTRTWNAVSAPGPALVIVPGLAFDRSGGRLGRGGGFYDRFITRIRLESRAAEETAPLFVGFGFREQVVDQVPMDSNDEVLDALLTDEGLLFFD